MILEALIAILIFSVGILAIVGMQATAIQDMGEAKYRTEAAFLANRIVAEMWGSMGANPAQVQANLGKYAYAGSGAAPAQIADWVDTVQDRLPGAKDFPPIIKVGVDNDVTVTVRWRAPRDKSAGATAHSYQAIAYLNP
jgi:type IV pilus assembly protein PilV